MVVLCLSLFSFLNMVSLVNVLSLIGVEKASLFWRDSHRMTYALLGLSLVLNAVYALWKARRQRIRQGAGHVEEPSQTAALVYMVASFSIVVVTFGAIMVKDL